MSKVSFNDKTVEYNGKEQSLLITGTLPTGVSVSYSNNVGKDASVYYATAIFTIADPHNYEEVPSKTATLTITKASYNVSNMGFEDAVYEYDGTEKSIVLNGELPEGISVIYTNNKGTEVGIYNAVAEFIIEDTINFNEIPDLTATLTITKAKIEATEIGFTDKTYIYDGTEKRLEITNPLPEGITVTYKNNTRTEVGSTVATAIFTVIDTEHYELIEDMTATLTINKITYDVSNLEFKSAEYVYDGTEKSILINGELPNGVTVSYENNTATNAGEYIAVAKFILSDPEHYYEIPDMTATLTITKATHNMSGITFEDAEFVYDGTEKSILIGGTLPTGVTVNYINNGQTEVGVYEVTAQFIVADTENYNLIEDKKAILEIVSASGTITITNKDKFNKVYDGKSVVEPIYEQSREGSVKVEYYVGSEAVGEVLESAPINAGTYTVKVILEATNNYLEATDQATFTIEKATYDMSDITFEDRTYVYDGTEKSIFINGVLPSGVSVHYEGNGKIEIDTYEVIAIFNIVDTVNYNTIPNMTATLTIEKATYDMSNVKFEDATYQYDGEEKEILISGELPEGVEVSYTNNKGIDSGTYEAVASFSNPDSEHYNDILDMYATLTITKIPATIEITNKDAFGKVYDGMPIIEPTYEASREGTIIIEYYNAEGTLLDTLPTNAGTYTIKVILAEEKNDAGAIDEVTFTIEKATHDMSNVKFEDIMYEYDGEPKEIVISGELPEGVTVSYENNKGTEIGTYYAKAIFTIEDSVNYNEISPMEATLTIGKATLDMSKVKFQNTTYTYDGTEKTLLITGELPAGVEVTYEGNKGTIVGEYPAVAKFSNPNPEIYNDIPNMEATLIIRKATYDMSNVKFENATYTYDGTEKTLLITGELPEGIEVSYEGNVGTNAGTYPAVAKFTIPDTHNYNTINDMTAILTIEKATYDMSGVTFVDKTVEYNGTEQSIVITGKLPNGVAVEYDNNTGIEVGTYHATARFLIADPINYEWVNDKTATLTIKQATGKIEITNKEAFNKVYDGKAVVTPEYTQSREGNVGIEYYVGTQTTGEAFTEPPINAGTYTVKVILEATKNYLEATDQATFIIQKATHDMTGITFESATYIYDGTEKEIVISGELPEGVTVKYTDNKRTEVGTSNAVASFELEDSLNYNAIPNMTATLKIEKATYDMTGVTFESATYQYDGEEKEIVISGELPEGVEVSYKNNKGTDSGIYEAVASFSNPDPEHYNNIPDMYAILTITKVPATIEITNKDAFGKVYDGMPIVEPTYEASREGTITIEYYNAEGTLLDTLPMNAGTYKIKVILAEEKNDAGATDEVTFTIEKATYDMSNVKFEDAKYEYDGTEKEIVISGELPAGVKVEYENNKGTEIGSYHAIAKFTIPDEENYNLIPDMTAELIIGKATLDMSKVIFESATYIYDGKEKQIVISGELPEGVEVTYENNKATIVGEYPAVAKFSNPNPAIYKDIPDMTATLKIEKATYDMSGITFEDAYHVYDGTEKTLLITGKLPEGVQVTYENNKATNAGDYKAVAKFTIPDTYNYNEIPNKEAVLRISKATYDMSHIKFESAEYEYDGEKKEIVISGELPEGVTVEYENNIGTDVGEYAAIAKFIVADLANYNAIENKTATLKITPARGKIEITNKDAFNKTYDGKAVVTPEYTQSRPGNVRIEYYVGTQASGEVLESAPINAGTYTVKAILEATNNYLEATDQTTFTISKITFDMSGITFESEKHIYDGQPKTILIKGELPEGVTVSYENNTGTEVGVYEAIAKFATPDIINYTEIPNKTATLTIEKATYDMSKVKFEDATYLYDGTEKKIEISGELPDGVTVSYENNIGIDAGIYEAVASFSNPDPIRYNDIPNMEATLEITKIPSTIEITNKDAFGKVYDGEPIVEPTYDVSREGNITIEYYDAEGNVLDALPMNAGTYTVKIILAEETNYTGAIDEVTFTIEKATYDMSGVTFEDATYEYDGEEKEIVISGNLPEGVTVSYENNKGTEIGAYHAIARFTIEDPINYNEILPMEATLIIGKVTIDMSGVVFENITYTYDGTEKEIVISGELPEGVTVSYEGNKGTIVGEYHAIAKFSNPNPDRYHDIPDKEATLIIEKATYDMSKVTFEDVTYTYDGEPKEIVISGELPEGVTVSYEGNKGTNAGEYPAVAKFTIPDTHNYHAIEDKKATLTIEKANHDMTGITFEDVTYEYDGTEKQLVIGGELPEGVKVEYDNNTGTDVGEYIAIARFIVEDLANYNEIPEKTATLTIKQATGKIEITNKEAFNKVYDGKVVVTPEYTQSREGTVRIEYYEGTQAKGESFTEPPINAGTYTVKVILEETKNYLETSDQATFTIEKATHDMTGITFESATYIYDGAPKEIVISGELPEGVKVEYENNTRTTVGTSEAIAKFTVEDSVNYNEIENKLATLTIEKATYDMTGVTFEDAIYEYDGTQKEILISGELPEGVTVSYENNTGINAGEYKAIAKFTIPDTENYYQIQDMTATLTITQILGSIKIINGEQLNKVYDGISVIDPEYEIVGDGEVIIQYYEGETLLEEAPKDAGNYKVRVTLQASKNYASASDEVDFEITKASYNMEGIIFEDATYPYDGTQKEITINGILPEGVNVKYENNTGTDAGIYEATAIFTVVDNRNYNIPSELTATLTITQVAGSISITNKALLNKVYDGNAVIAPEYEKVGEGDVTVTYYEGETQLESAPIEVGTYRVEVKLEETNNYGPASDEATIEITKATYDMNGVKFEDATYEYDGTQKEIVISGNLPTGVEVSYENNIGIDVGEYIANAIFTGDSKNYYPIDNKVATLTITQTAGKMIIKNKDAFDKIYDGLPVAEPIYEATDGNVIIEYYVGSEAIGEILPEAPINTGIYTVKVIVQESRNYTEAFDIDTFEITKATHDMSGVTFEDVEYEYDGEPKEIVISGNLPEGVTVEYENNKGTIIGEYPAVAKFIVEDLINYHEIEDMTATMKIVPKRTRITITNKESLNKVYDGKIITRPTYKTTGEGNVRIEYYNGTEAIGEILSGIPINAGIYTVKVVLEQPGSIEEIFDTATFEISKASYDMSGVSFEDQTYPYDGTEKRIVLTGKIPTGVMVSYENNTHIDVGEYEAVVKFRVNNQNYYEIEDMRATLTITQSEGYITILNKDLLKKEYDGTPFAEPAYQRSGDGAVRFEYYDGETKLEGAPIEVGTYKVCAILEATNNYGEASDEAIIEIIKATYDMSGVTFENVTYTYDGEPKEIVISGELPEGVTVEYENNKGTEVGEYQAIAKFINPNPGSYHDIPNMEATLIIEKATYDMSGVTFENVTYTYDGEEKEIVISGELPENITVEYENNKGTEAGKYQAIAKFINSNPENYHDIPNMEATLIIEKATYDMSGVTFEDATYEYDGEQKEIVISGELPEGVTVEYENNKGTEVGEYQAIAKFNGDEQNYYSIENMTAVLTIEEKTEIDFGKYEVVEYEGIKYIEYVDPNTIIEEFLNEITEEQIETIEIIIEGNLVEDNHEIITTGTEIQIKIGNKIFTYIAIVKGDVYRDGMVDQKDLLMLARYIVEYEDALEYVNDYSLRASDVHQDGLFAKQQDLLALAIMLIQ